jgi:ribosomal protein L31E
MFDSTQGKCIVPVAHQHSHQHTLSIHQRNRNTQYGRHYINATVTLNTDVITEVGITVSLRSLKDTSTHQHASTTINMIILARLAHRHISTSPHQHIDPVINTQRVNAPAHKHITTTHQHINTPTQSSTNHQHSGMTTSTHQHINTPTRNHQHTSTHRIIYVFI